MSTAFPAFGPPGQQWTYSDSNDTYDLTTQQSAKIFKFKPTISEGVTVPKSLGAGNAEVIIDPEATALVIVDMQNFFLDPTCMEHPKGLAAVQLTIKTIKKCREAGIQVIWLNWGLTDTDMESMPASVQRGFFHHEYSVIPPDGKPSRGGLGVDLGPDKGRTLFSHTWNADIYPELKTCVESTDIHCAKNRMSGLWSPEQPLYKTLKEEKKTTVLFAGVNTDQCVLGTLVDGYNNGWACVMIEDACGTTTAGAREVTLSNVSAYYGFVTDSDKFSAGVLESK